MFRMKVSTSSTDMRPIGPDAYIDARIVPPLPMISSHGWMCRPWLSWSAHHAPIGVMSDSVTLWATGKLSPSSAAICVVSSLLSEVAAMTVAPRDWSSSYRSW